MWKALAAQCTIPSPWKLIMAQGSANAILNEMSNPGECLANQWVRRDFLLRRRNSSFLKKIFSHGVKKRKWVLWKNRIFPVSTYGWGSWHCGLLWLPALLLWQNITTLQQHLHPLISAKETKFSTSGPLCLLPCLAIWKFLQRPPGSELTP